MKILFVSATPFEITPLTDFLKQNWVQFGAQQYQKGEHSVELQTVPSFALRSL